MSITKKQFESLEGISYFQYVLNYLALNSTKAFTRKELGKTFHISKIAMRDILHRLKKAGLVENKPPYWTIKKGIRPGKILNWVRGIWKQQNR